MNNLLNINKTKYRYLMDNLDLSKNRTIMTYTIPVPKGEEKPTDYEIRMEIPRTRNNKNNILSLKAEDVANMMNGVVDAEISSLLDGEYDSELTVIFDSSVNSNAEDIAAKLDEHIRTIASYTKFAVGKIKYNVILDPSRKTVRDKTFKIK